MRPLQSAYQGEDWNATRRGKTKSKEGVEGSVIKKKGRSPIAPHLDAPPETGRKREKPKDPTKRGAAYRSLISIGLKVSLTQQRGPISMQGGTASEDESAQKAGRKPLPTTCHSARGPPLMAASRKKKKKKKKKKKQGPKDVKITRCTRKRRIHEHSFRLQT